MAVLQAPKTQQMFETGTEITPKGTYVATCIDIKDLFGVERKKFQSEEMEKLDITAFLFGLRDRTGKPYKIASRPFRISGNEKSSLFAFLKSWLGQPPKMGWDYMELKGRQALVTVDHTPSKRTPGLTYADIVSISPVPEGIQAPAAPAQPAPVQPAAVQPSPAPMAVEDNDPIPF